MAWPGAHAADDGNVTGACDCGCTTENCLGLPSWDDEGSWRPLRILQAVGAAAADGNRIRFSSESLNEDSAKTAHTGSEYDGDKQRSGGGGSGWRELTVRFEPVAAGAVLLLVAQPADRQHDPVGPIRQL